ncbi:hypothetical protein [Brevundimonas subvibrioides]|uniref:hypothetical protein n=1 Tax=Brevundimonas subvibrioides TaxID=74313 RepID=UPI0005A22014|nr:hypothetical protein [Brevundimonas subvibrioides]
MTRFQRLLIVLAVANAATTWWVISTGRQAQAARTDLLAHLNRTYGSPLAETAMSSREAMWVNSTAAWEANALRWALIGYAATAAILIIAWVARGRPSAMPT